MFADELTSALCSENQVNTVDCSIIESALLYAERFQHKPKGFYNIHQIPPKTEQAIVLMVVHMTKPNSDDSIWSKVDSLLRFNIN